MDEINIENRIFKGFNIPTEHSNVLMIQGDKGFLGCGYFQIETADKLDEAVAIVTKVKSYDDMLRSEVIKVSGKAKELGIQLGMKGKEALIQLSL